MQFEDEVPKGMRSAVSIAYTVGELIELLSRLPSGLPVQDPIDDSPYAVRVVETSSSTEGSYLACRIEPYYGDESNRDYD